MSIEGIDSRAYITQRFLIKRVLGVNNYGNIRRYAAMPPVLPLSRRWE